MFAALLTLVIVLAFAAGPFLVPNFGGFSADLFPVPQRQPAVQPAGWAFAIWGPIYLWLVVSALFGLVFRARDADWAAMRPALIASIAIGAAWLPVAQRSPLLAAAMIWLMLVTGLAALFRAPMPDRLMASWPVGLYVGWLSAAACVALGLNLAGYGLLPEALAAQAMILLATALAAGVQMYLRRVPTYGAAVVWAFVAIYVANDGRNGDVAALAMGSAIAIAAITLFVGVRDLKRGTA
jgi:hypothetical protein